MFSKSCMDSRFIRSHTHQVSLRAFSWFRRAFIPVWGFRVPATCHTVRRGYLVYFQETPNEECYKFYLDQVFFLPPGSHTMMFDRTNDYQSPLARHLLEALPMVEEVTVGSSFVTVKRVEKGNAEAAARFFATRFNGTLRGGTNGEAEATAARSEALQQAPAQPITEHQNQHLNEDGEEHQADGASPAHREAAGSFEMGGFSLSPAPTESNEVDPEVIQSLIESASWSELKLDVCALLTEHLYSGRPHVSPDAPHPHIDTLPQDGDSEVVLMIKELIDTTIRPQLQNDGGDIRFIRFEPETGLMVVELLGACRSCRSGPRTLVQLIERTTSHWIPEVTGVLELNRNPATVLAKSLEEVEEAETCTVGTGSQIELDLTKVPVLRRTVTATPPPAHPDAEPPGSSWSAGMKKKMSL